MIIDSRSLEADTTLSADVCIVGSGAAGMTLANELMDSGLTVLVMESGGRTAEEKTESLKQGELEGEVFEMKPGYLQTERMRMLGGTSNVWEGICRPLQAIDFEPRDWMPNSGWPINRDVLDPYYNRACEYIGIQRLDSETIDPETVCILPEDGDWEGLNLHKANEPQLMPKLVDRFEASTEVSIYLFANAMSFKLGESGDRIEEAHFGIIEGGKRITVKAKMFALCAGGIESCRILLSSNQSTNATIGNEHDCLGRYFLDQLHTPGGRLVVHDPIAAHRVFGRIHSDVLGYVKMGMYTLREEAQRRHRLSNQALIFGDAQRKWFGPDENKVADEFDTIQNRIGHGALKDTLPKEYWFRFKSELTASPENRIQLTDTVDELGMPRLKITWQVSQSDRDMLDRFANLLGDTLGANLMGRKQSWFNPNEPLPEHTMGHGHQLGGMRMSSDPRKGVVDANCRIHGTDNFFAVSGAVFPGGGNTNPTMTIMALSIRLADQIKKEALS